VHVHSHVAVTSRYPCQGQWKTTHNSHMLSPLLAASLPCQTSTCDNVPFPPPNTCAPLHGQLETWYRNKERMRTTVS
jgi:hypothetical protein